MIRVSHDLDAIRQRPIEYQALRAKTGPFRGRCTTVRFRGWIFHGVWHQFPPDFSMCGMDTVGTVVACKNFAHTDY